MNSNAGRPQKPLSILKTTGQFRKDRHGEREKSELKPTLLKGAKPPKSLSTDARKEWRSLVPELQRLGVVTVLDVPALCRYCENLVQWERCRAVIQENGLTYTTDTGQIKPRPEVNIMFHVQRELLNLAGQFGCTPAARARMVLNKNAGSSNNDDDLASLLRPITGVNQN